MALTREERQTIETLIKKVRTLEDDVTNLKRLIETSQEILTGLGFANDMNDWTSSQWDDFLRPYILKYVEEAKTSKHNHTNDQQGGDCFAKLGARLISGE